MQDEEGKDRGSLPAGFHARLAGSMYLLTIGAYLAGSWLTTGAEKGPLGLAMTQAERIGLMMMLATSWATMLLAALLYAVLRTVDPILALLAFAWRSGEAVLGALAVVVRFALLEAPGPAVAPTAAGIPARELHGALLNATALFFTAGSTLFFWLFLKSGFIPRSLASFGMAASLLFALFACAHLLGLHLAAPMTYSWMPILVAEIVTGLWLLAFGLNIPHQAGSPRS